MFGLGKAAFLLAATLYIVGQSSQMNNHSSRMGMEL
jgi:hypothetical protein